MTRIPFSQRAAITAAMLALAFTLTRPIIAAEDPKPARPSATEAQKRDLQDARSEDRADCKKVYKWVRRGHPTKGIVVRRLVRVECPTPRA